MNIDWNAVGADVIKFLQAGAAVVESPGFQSVAALGGPQVASAAKIAEGLAEVSGTLVADAAAASSVFSSDDLATIQAADTKIQAANVALAQQVASS